MPVFRSGVHPREPMVQLHAKECVCNAEMMVSAKLQQTLAIFVAFADAKMTEAVGPRALIVAHSGIEIAKKNQRFILRDDCLLLISICILPASDWLSLIIIKFNLGLFRPLTLSDQHYYSIFHGFSQFTSMSHPPALFQFISIICSGFSC